MQNDPRNEIARACPASNWAKHRFSTDLRLANDQHIVVRFDLPQRVDDISATLFTPDKVESEYGDIILKGREKMDPEMYEEVCAAIADLLNTRIAMIQKDVSTHLTLCAAVLQALLDEKWVLAYVLISQLSNELLVYQGELWLYEWPEWVTSVEIYLTAVMSDQDKQMLRKIIKDEQDYGK